MLRDLLLSVRRPAGVPFLLFVVLAALLAAVPRGLAEENAAFPLTVTDLAGRSVTIAAPPQRIVLAEGLQLLSLALVAPDPTARLALIGRDLAGFDPGLAGMLGRAFPGLADVPTISDDGAGLPLETVLSARPDLVIFSLWQKPRVEPQLAEFEALGIPVVFIDFFVAPVENTPASLRLLGAVMGTPERAEAYVGFYEAHLAEVRRRIAASATPAPSVFIHAYPGTWACCWSAGKAGFGEFVEIAGGRNIGAELFPSELGGTLAPEFVLAANPAVYVATGLSSTGGEGLEIGADVAAEAARAGLGRVAALPVIADLGAVQAGRVHGLWNFFNGSPLNILAVEALAGWFHPEAMRGVDPADTLAEINRRFAAAPITGSFWSSLGNEADAP
ncbi:ABC transporter substrate-binding protein [Methylobrevis albus]|uniref:ABC transporter substrate-binding protein n=1 Tax=Methylobrevis albus TaxID=2793297 RepID=A0A931I1Z6_9HYPH|nr:ABC transporter substrate-binding protein [Methylobrevis albus]MBH0238347.1 ABC transporter substrate-binding protein [Methylobrevis albus]